jgi:hypothetical protein
MTPAPRPATADDDVRDVFAPLAADEPASHELARLRRAAISGRRSRSRLLPRRFYGVVAITASIAVAFALLPGSSPKTGVNEDVGVLRAAAAVAAERPIPNVADGRWRYAKVRETHRSIARDGDRVVEARSVRIEESWVGPRWQGRTRLAPSQFDYTGSASLANELRRWYVRHDDYFTKALEIPYAYGDGPTANLDPRTLPEDRDAIAHVLREGIRLDRWGPYPESRGRELMPPGNDRDSYITYKFIGLLVNARLTPAQRAALLDVLATDPAARDLGTMTDSEGRQGRGVALDYEAPGGGLPAHSYRVIFDPDTAEILEWWYPTSTTRPEHTDGQRPLVPKGPTRVVTVLETGYTDTIGQRP